MEYTKRTNFCCYQVCKSLEKLATQVTHGMKFHGIILRLIHETNAMIMTTLQQHVLLTTTLHFVISTNSTSLHEIFTIHQGFQVNSIWIMERNEGIVQFILGHSRLTKVESVAFHKCLPNVGGRPSFVDGSMKIHHDIVLK